MVLLGGIVIAIITAWIMNVANAYFGSLLCIIVFILGLYVEHLWYSYCRERHHEDN